MEIRSKRDRNGRFVNQPATPLGFGLKTSLTLLRDALKGNPKGRPDRPIPVERLRLGSDGQPRITWWGHSALLLEIACKRILLDPMFGPSPSPVALFGAKRYSQTLPIETGGKG
jgi:hypothetical protein